MTAKKLHQYRALCREIVDLEKKIEKEARKDQMASDVVSGSDSEYPYTRRHFTITGKESNQTGQLRRMQDKCHKERNEIVAYIDAIENSTMRQIFRYRHIEGLSWRAVAFRLGGYDTEDGVRKKHDRYLRKN